MSSPLFLPLLTPNANGLLQQTLVGAVSITEPVGSPPTSPDAGKVVLLNASGQIDSSLVVTGGGGEFGNITSGTNVSAVMVVGLGASINFMDTGVINANQLYDVAIDSTPPTPGQVLTAVLTGSSPPAVEAIWQAPSNSIAELILTVQSNPTSASTAGTTGQIAWGITGSPPAPYIYLCTVGGAAGFATWTAAELTVIP